MVYFNTNTSPLLAASGVIAMSFNGEVITIYASGGGGGGTPGGADTQVQFNDGGSFNGDAGLVYNKTTDALTGLGNFSASGFIATGETASTIASFDGGKKVTSLQVATYPSLTELARVKGLDSSFSSVGGDEIELALVLGYLNLTR